MRLAEGQVRALVADRPVAPGEPAHEPRPREGPAGHRGHDADEEARHCSPRAGGRRVIAIRPGRIEDLEALAVMRALLWPNGSVEEHREDARELLLGRPRSTLPQAVFVAEIEGRL